MQISAWERESFFAAADVVIVGAGLTGLWSAWHLLKLRPGCRILILEKGLIPQGASTRNAGFACFGSPTELLADEQRMGTDAMLEMLEMRYRGLRMAAQLLDGKNFDFELSGGYELFTSSQGYRQDDVHQQLNYLNSLLKPITNTPRTFQIPAGLTEKTGFGKTDFIVRNRLEGVLHPGKLVLTLSQHLQGQSVRILYGQELVRWEKTEQNLALFCRSGLSLTANQLLICSNGFSSRLLPQEDIKPARGQVLLTEPVGKLSWKGSYHSHEGYYYFRNWGNDRVLLGGARFLDIDKEETEELETSMKIQQALEKYIRQIILPGQKVKIAARWSGIMGMGKTSKGPLLKKIDDNICCAIRLSGIGVALSPVLGEQAAKLLLKK